MFDALDNDKEPRETFYDGYVVNAVMDACYRSIKSKQWESVDLEVWRGAESKKDESLEVDTDEEFILIKTEKMPDGRAKLILKHRESGKIIQKIKE